MNTPRRNLFGVGLFGVGLCVVVAAAVWRLYAQTGSPGLVAIQQIKPAGQGAIHVESPAFVDGQSIPEVFSDYGEKISPPLKWSGVPSGARSLILMIEDPDAAEPKPFVHWHVYNLPPTQSALEESVPPLPKLKEYGDALQGLNSRGSIGYTGPHPPKGDPAHHYHFELFALDQTLQLDPGVDRAKVLTAMSGHVMAAGEMVGLFKAPAAK